MSTTTGTVKFFNEAKASASLLVKAAQTSLFTTARFRVAVSRLWLKASKSTSPLLKARKALRQKTLLLFK